MCIVQHMQLMRPLQRVSLVRFPSRTPGYNFFNRSLEVCGSLHNEGQFKPLNPSMAQPIFLRSTYPLGLG